MNHLATADPAKPSPLPSAPAVGCATCWAANYCAAFSALASPQPPPGWPLLGQLAPLRPPRRSQLAQR